MNIKKYQILGTIFVVILGTILHFAYSLSNKNIIIGFFCPINESPWEHLKMIITPMIIFSIFEYYLYGKDIENFFSIRALSILIGMLLIICLFYTYSGALGKNFLILDILIFIISVYFAYLFSHIFFRKDIFNSNNSNFIGLIFIFILILAMVYFTSNPINIPLFISSFKLI